MQYGSLFSGIGGFDLGLDRAGMQCAWQVEKDASCRKVLAKHWPGVPKHDDVSTFAGQPVQLICGGFPCQDVSVAGKRSGLAGSRSGLWFEFERIIRDLSPAWVVIENVPGLLSSSRGRDMGAVVGSLAEFGYGVAWRVLDAQNFGLAQRRKRVFIVGNLGNPRRAAEVLFESEGMPWDSTPRGETREEVAGTLGGGSGKRGWCDDTDRATFIFDWQSGGDVWHKVSETHSSALHVEQVPAVAHCLNGKRGKRDDAESETFVFEPRIARNGRGQPDTVAPSLSASESGVHGDSKPHVAGAFGVRRLMPIECERLQGFPDGWTEGHSDSRRYAMLGNAVAVPVAEWIGRRIVACNCSP